MKVPAFIHSMLPQGCPSPVLGFFIHWIFGGFCIHWIYDGGSASCISHLGHNFSFPYECFHCWSCFECKLQVVFHTPFLSFSEILESPQEHLKHLTGKILVSKVTHPCYYVTVFCLFNYANNNE